MSRRVSTLLFASVLSIFISCTKDNAPAGTFTPPPPVQGKNYTADEVAAFTELAFNTLNIGSGTIIRLPSKASYYIADTSSAYFVKQVDDIIAEFNSITDSDLVIRRTNVASEAIIHIYFTDTATYFKAEPEAVSFFHSKGYELVGMNYLDWGSGNIIDHGSIFVDRDSAGKDTSLTRFIVYHEMMHSLGMLGHTDYLQFGSIMYIYSLTPYLQNYSEFDKKMIHLLYNPAIKPGMDKDAFDAVIVNL